MREDYGSVASTLVTSFNHVGPRSVDSYTTVGLMGSGKESLGGEEGGALTTAPVPRTHEVTVHAHPVSPFLERAEVLAQRRRLCAKFCDVAELALELIATLVMRNMFNHAFPEFHTKWFTSFCEEEAEEQAAGGVPDATKADGNNTSSNRGNLIGNHSHLMEPFMAALLGKCASFVPLLHPRSTALLLRLVMRKVALYYLSFLRDSEKLLHVFTPRQLALVEADVAAIHSVYRSSLRSSTLDQRVKESLIEDIALSVLTHAVVFLREPLDSQRYLQSVSGLYEYAARSPYEAYPTSAFMRMCFSLRLDKGYVYKRDLIDAVDPDDVVELPSPRSKTDATNRKLVKSRLVTTLAVDAVAALDPRKIHTVPPSAAKDRGRAGEDDLSRYAGGRGRSPSNASMSITAQDVEVEEDTFARDLGFLELIYGSSKSAAKSRIGAAATLTEAFIPKPSADRKLFDGTVPARLRNRSYRFSRTNRSSRSLSPDRAGGSGKMGGRPGDPEIGDVPLYSWVSHIFCGSGYTGGTS